ncbi:hypothetical protein Bpfe_000209 [Biomphalaria pfeifferi]|uniref:C2H2-type domain-containing protein n=1 Tax=Biomphalaria pfeifferi TaxID=112525 RepID=A0AAD8CC40_BIOPF|nr:hypothetical protein Bpfe_000209 [Biomphalaria pfeifferi]
MSSSTGLVSQKSQLTPSALTPNCWMPGLGCPVPYCGAKIIPTTARLREHWNDKHEEIVAKFHCSMCAHITKRKSNLVMHFRSRHVECDISQCVGEIKNQSLHTEDKETQKTPIGMYLYTKFACPVKGCEAKSALRNRKPLTPLFGLWRPGMGCPVPGCSAKVIRQAIHLKIHWTEKHEKIVVKYHCSMCDVFSKRKSNLFQHYRQKHGGDISQSVGNIEHHYNREFQDPYPLTLEAVMGKPRQL